MPRTPRRGRWCDDTRRNQPAGGLSRSRRHADRRGRLSRSSRPRHPLSLVHRRDSRSTAPASPSSWSRTSRGSPAGSSRKRLWIASTAESPICLRRGRAPRRVLLLSAPPARQRARAYRACDCRKPGRASWIGRSRNCVDPLARSRVGDQVAENRRARPEGRRSWCAGQNRLRRGRRTSAVGRRHRRCDRQQSGGSSQLDSRTRSQSLGREPEA